MQLCYSEVLEDYWLVCRIQRIVDILKDKNPAKNAVANKPYVSFRFLNLLLRHPLILIALWAGYTRLVTYRFWCSVECLAISVKVFLPENQDTEQILFGEVWVRLSDHLKYHTLINTNIDANFSLKIASRVHCGFSPNQ